MEVTILEEHGLLPALYGFSLSYKDRSIRREDWIPFEGVDIDSGGVVCDIERVRKYMKVLKTNAGRGMGHDKFLRQLIVYIDMELPRYLWSEVDTYKVGTVAQSESTMHTLMRRTMRKDDCTEDTQLRMIQLWNKGYPYKNIQAAKANLPEGYLQRRVVSMNYANIANIIIQRSKHRLTDWHFICNALYRQVLYPQFLPKPACHTGE